MVFKFFHKKTGWGIRVNQQLAKELHKPVIEKFERREVYARFKDKRYLSSRFSCNGIIIFKE